MHPLRKSEFTFHTQLPHDDGCGLRVLQMLTDREYDDLASMVDWGDRRVHYMRWAGIRQVLDAVEKRHGEPMPASS